MEPTKVSELSFENVIFAVFVPKFYDEVFNFIKYNGGHVRAEAWLLSQGYHSSFVTAVIKKLLRERGW